MRSVIIVTLLWSEVMDPLYHSRHNGERLATKVGLDHAIRSFNNLQAILLSSVVRYFMQGLPIQGGVKGIHTPKIVNIGLNN